MNTHPKNKFYVVYIFIKNILKFRHIKRIFYFIIQR